MVRYVRDRIYKALKIFTLIGSVCVCVCALLNDSREEKKELAFSL